MTQRNTPSIAAALDELRGALEINQGQFKFQAWSRMRPEVAAMHEARLRRAIELLEWLKRNERLIKHRMAQ